MNEPNTIRAEHLRPGDATLHWGARWTITNVDTTNPGEVTLTLVDDVSDDEATIVADDPNQPIPCWPAETIPACDLRPGERVWRGITRQIRSIASVEVRADGWVWITWAGGQTTPHPLGLHYEPLRVQTPRPAVVTASDAKHRRPVVVHRAGRPDMTGTLVHLGPDGGAAKVRLDSGAYLTVPAATVTPTATPEPSIP